MYFSNTHFIVVIQIYHLTDGKIKVLNYINLYDYKKEPR